MKKKTMFLKLSILTCSLLMVFACLTTAIASDFVDYTTVPTDDPNYPGNRVWGDNPNAAASYNAGNPLASESNARAAIVAAYDAIGISNPSTADIQWHYDAIAGNWATPQEVIMNILQHGGLTKFPDPATSGSGDSNGGLAGAIASYNICINPGSYPLPGNCIETFPPPSVSVDTQFQGSINEGGSFYTTVSGTLRIKKEVDKEKDKNDDGDTDDPGEKWKEIEDDTVSLGPFVHGTAIATKLETNRSTPEATMSLKVVDTTAPWAAYLAGYGASPGHLTTTTGDFMLVKVEIEDNNLYKGIRTPWLYYETRPQQDADIETWAGEPLILEAASSNPGPPFSPNKAVYRAMIPVPYAYKGKDCIKWYVNIHDGSDFSHHHGAGNHSKADFSFNGGSNQADVHGTEYGYVTLYDNDRPNIILNIWEKTRTGIERIATYEVKENYQMSDFYNTHLTGSPYIGIIPDDDLLKQGPDAHPLPAELEPYVLPEMKDLMAAELKNQMSHEKSPHKKEFTVGDKGEVIYEDRKYFFTVDVDDNVKGVSDGTGVRSVPKLKRTRLFYQFKEPSDNIDMTNWQEIPRSGQEWHWYLSPQDPKQFENGTKDCYAFEHIFHRKIMGDDPKDTSYLFLKAVDNAEHERYLYLYIRVGDVRSDFQSFDQKVLRQGTSEAEIQQENSD